MKIRTLDNMLSQVYPFLYKTYRHDGVNVPIKDKIVQLWSDMTPYFVQELSEETNNIIDMQVHEILNYVHLNFNGDYKLIKMLIINTPRTKLAQALFKPISNLALQDTISKCNKEKSKFSDGYVSKGMYKKDDGTFGEAQIDFPPLNNEQYIKDGNMRNHQELYK